MLENACQGVIAKSVENDNVVVVAGLEIPVGMSVRTDRKRP